MTDRLQIGAREAITLVAVRELKVRLRSKGFQILLVLTAVVSVAFPLIFHFANLGPGAAKIAVVQQDAALRPALEATAAQLGQKITVSTVADHRAGVDQVTSGRADVLAESSPRGLIQVSVKKSLSDPLKQLFTVVDQRRALDDQITGLGGDPARVTQALASAQVRVTALAPGNSPNGQRITIAITAAFMLYFTLMMLGQMLAMGVVEEKSSRVIELLLSTVKPWQLLAGKVIGNGLLGLLQMLVPAVFALGTALLTGAVTLSVGNSVGTVAWALVWFLAGFALYALVYAALGATVSRQEDIGGATFPATSPLIVAWIIAISVLPTHPDNSLAMWLSLLPPTAPVLMPMRIALGVAPLWQALLALVLTLGCSGLLLRFAGRIYRNSVLRSGARVPLREALKAA